MPQKTNLLKELGWDDALIKHFMIEDSELISEPQEELKTEVSDTNSLFINYNAHSSGTALILESNKITNK